MSTLKDTILEDVKSAMRAKDKARLGTLRLITAAIKQIEVDTRETLNDTKLITLLDKLCKQRRDSIEQYTKAGREDLADIERTELELIQTYLPEPLSDTELDTLIAEAISSTGASTMADMGKVMGTLKPKVQGRTDIGKLSAVIKERLQSLS